MDGRSGCASAAPEDILRRMTSSMPLLLQVSAVQCAYSAATAAARLLPGSSRGSPCAHHALPLTHPALPSLRAPLSLAPCMFWCALPAASLHALCLQLQISRHAATCHIQPQRHQHHDQPLKSLSDSATTVARQRASVRGASSMYDEMGT